MIKMFCSRKKLIKFNIYNIAFVILISDLFDKAEAKLCKRKDFTLCSKKAAITTEPGLGLLTTDF